MIFVPGFVPAFILVLLSYRARGMELWRGWGGVIHIRYDGNATEVRCTFFILKTFHEGSKLCSNCIIELFYNLAKIRGMVGTFYSFTAFAASWRLTSSTTWRFLKDRTSALLPSQAISSTMSRLSRSPYLSRNSHSLCDVQSPQRMSFPVKHTRRNHLEISKVRCDYKCHTAARLDTRSPLLMLKSLLVNG